MRKREKKRKEKEKRERKVDACIDSPIEFHKLHKDSGERKQRGEKGIKITWLRKANVVMIFEFFDLISLCSYFSDLPFYYC